MVNCNCNGQIWRILYLIEEAMEVGQPKIEISPDPVSHCFLRLVALALAVHGGTT